MKIYISGPMTGLPNYNYDAFHEAEMMLAGSPGNTVINPANNFNGDQSLPRKDYLRKDVGQVLEAEMLYMLNGWRNSAGARLEWMLGRELGLGVMYEEDTALTVVEPVEMEASRIVRNGERQAIYGHPSADFIRTSAMWSAILGHEVTTQQMALMMACLKISRLSATPDHRDSLVDLIGYAICYSRLEETP